MDQSWRSIKDPKARKRAYHRAWYLANKEHVIALNKKWRATKPHEYHLQNKRKYYRRNVSQRQIEHRRKRYGLTDTAYQALLASQGGACWICKRVRKLGVDHDHETNEVRGLLCIPCNRAIAALDDNAAGLRNALRYFNKQRLLEVRRLIKKNS